MSGWVETGSKATILQRWRPVSSFQCCRLTSSAAIPAQQTGRAAQPDVHQAMARHPSRPGKFCRKGQRITSSSTTGITSLLDHLNCAWDEGESKPACLPAQVCSLGSDRQTVWAAAGIPTVAAQNCHPPHPAATPRHQAPLQAGEGCSHEQAWSPRRPACSYKR